jgi:2-oxoglutarate ferredoxin oxidoreductase subunit delta
MKKGKITIDRERCKGCYLCIRACPMHLIVSDTTTNLAGIYPAAYIKNDNSGTPVQCIACGSCDTVCPDTAIEVWEQEGAE